jgi:hypothetical protein
VDTLFEYYTYERLRKSQAHPAPRESIQQIWQVMEKRLRDPVNNEPVRIAFMGGSVTAGRTCDVNPLYLPDTNHMGKAMEWCAYPSRLQVLLDRVLFPDRSKQDRDAFPIFEVTNMAVPGTNSLVGAMAMQYNLVPSLEQFPPHILVASYSANDAKEDENETYYENQPDFVRAAQRLRPCDDHLPLVVLADDWFSHERDLVDSLANTGTLFKTASWHNLMAVMYTNVVRTTAIGNANFTDAGRHPLFGSGRNHVWHPGMGFHIGQGWTLFFNLVGALHDACTHPASSPPLHVPPPVVIGPNKTTTECLRTGRCRSSPPSCPPSTLAGTTTLGTTSSRSGTPTRASRGLGAPRPATALLPKRLAPPRSPPPIARTRGWRTA